MINKKTTTLSNITITAGALVSVAMSTVLVTSAHAAPEVFISSTLTGSSTIVEQTSDGQVATITATPNSITMQNGMPFSVTQVTNVPRYVVSQGGTTVTSVPVTDSITNQVTSINVITTPTQPMPIVSNNAPILTNQVSTAPVISNRIISSQVVNNQAVTITSLDTLQLTPTFSTPDIVSANTKIMKIMKNRDGRDIAVPANHIAPGDIIEYHTTYTNTTAQPVRDLNAMVSLPNGVKLVSLNSPLPTLATSGGDSYQTIQQVGNSVVIQENYSGLKWNLVNLASNAPQTVVIRARVQ